MAWPSDLVRTKNWGTEVLTDSDLEGQFDLIINWLMASLNSSTGHSHSGSGNNGPRLASTGVTTTFGNGFTTVTGASTDYLLIAADVSDSNTTKKALASDFTFTPSASNALAGSVVQTVNTQTGAFASGTTNMVNDDSPPLVTEGDQYLSRTITPTSASNKLKIDVVLCIGSSGTTIIAGLFKSYSGDPDPSTAVAAQKSYVTAGGMISMKFTHYMTAPTTSEMTFTVRAGGLSGSQTNLNGDSGARLLGGVMASSITITEIKV